MIWFDQRYARLTIFIFIIIYIFQTSTKLIFPYFFRIQLFNYNTFLRWKSMTKTIYWMNSIFRLNVIFKIDIISISYLWWSSLSPISIKLIAIWNREHMVSNEEHSVPNTAYFDLQFFLLYWHNEWEFFQFVFHTLHSWTI